MCVSVERYTPERQQEWDEFVASSKQGTFLLLRSYMDYHADRFRDHSLMFFADRRLVALLPANAVSGHDDSGRERSAGVDGDTLVSHGGLTYGGLVTDARMTTALTLAVFEALRSYCQTRFCRVVYRPTPYIYHSLPADEDLYALFRQGAQLTAREVSSAVFMPCPPRWRTLRRRGVGKAEKHGLQVKHGIGHLPAFWPVLDANLSARHGVHPVHTLEEMQLLSQRFPDNIRLYTAWQGQELLGGMLLYLTRQVVHSQYIASTPRGKQLGCLDLVMHKLLTTEFALSSEYRFFDFGKSTEQAGAWLNENLIFQKEGFGARAVCYDTYTWTL